MQQVCASLGRCTGVISVCATAGTDTTGRPSRAATKALKICPAAAAAAAVQNTGVGGPGKNNTRARFYTCSAVAKTGARAARWSEAESESETGRGLGKGGMHLYDALLRRDRPEDLVHNQIDCSSSRIRRHSVGIATGNRLPKIHLISSPNSLSHTHAHAHTHTHTTRPAEQHTAARPGAGPEGGCSHPYAAPPSARDRGG